MVREILFKAKTEGGRWIEGDLIHYESGEVAILEKFSKYGREATEICKRTLVLPNTICQYTGLTDKNGNKIWENDIVIGREGYCGNPKLPTREIKFKVEYSHCHYRWLDNSDMYEFEVIGNIFDNP